MIESQNRTITLQWVIPSTIMVIVVVVMLFNFTNKSRAEASQAVSRELIQSTENYGDKFLSELSTMEKIANPIKLLLENDIAENSEYTARLLKSIEDSTGAYKVYYCDSEGNGVNSENRQISVGENEIFQAITESEDIPYIYTEEGSYLGRKTVIVVKRVNKSNSMNYVLMYYPLDQFRMILNKSEFDTDTFLALVDSEGKILGTSGADSVLLEGENLLDNIRGYDTEKARTVNNRMNNGTRGTTELQVGNESRMLVYVPLDTNDWKLVLGVNMGYVNRQVENKCKNTRSMLMELCIVVLIFVGVVVIVNVVGKIRINEKKRQLEDKADTDLLTGLNNKLATERKIKDYMVRHPDSQSMMFLLDIDNFKKINDTMGHAFGDEVLRSLGKQIGAIFRASDIIGRIGGDEFMIFLKGIDNEETIRKEAKKVEMFFRGFQAGEYVKYAATASIGVAIYPKEGADFETLYKAADQGLYKAKKRGKNQLAFYRDEWAQDEKDKTEQKA